MPPVFRLLVGVVVGLSFAVPVRADDPWPMLFTLTVSGKAGFPVIHGRTNMPDGTLLSIVVLPPREPDAEARMAAGLNACIPDCWFASEEKPMITVMGGEFTGGPYSRQGAPLIPRQYTVGIKVLETPAHGVYVAKDFHYTTTVQVQ